MSKENIEIIVTAKVENAIKEFKKIVPEVQKIVQEVQESFNKMDTKGMTNNVKNAVQIIRNKMEDLKKSNQNNIIKLTVNNKEAQKQISQVQKEINSLQEKINSREMKLKIKGEVEVDTNKIILPSEKLKGDALGEKENSGQDIFSQISNISGAITSQIMPLTGKLSGIFSPLKDSCKNSFSGIIEQVKLTSGQMDGLKTSVTGIFDRSFTLALDYNGNGDTIVKNLSDSLNNLLGAIDNVVKSEGFQNWLKTCSDKFREISEKISQVNWQPLIDVLSNVGQNIGDVALGILDGLVNIFKWLAENPIVAEILLAIATAIGIVSVAIGIWSAAQQILNMEIWSSPITWIIIAIMALIAIIVLCITHWDEIKNAISNAWETIKNAVSNAIEPIKQYLIQLWERVSQVFETIWNIISSIMNEIWQVISTIFQAIWNIISSILNSIWNIFSQIFNWIWQLISKVFQGIWNIISPIINKVWETIKFVLAKIQEIWSTVWNTISNVVNKVWNGIWNGIRTVINFILGGIEGFVNGTIRGINKLLSGISNVANAIGSLIGLDPINLQISTISLPRLAKGGVITRPTAVLAGEYLGARSNPEIVTPQNIMYDTMRKAIEDTNFYNSNSQQHLSIYYMGKEIFDDTIDYINEKTRKTGKCVIRAT